MKRETPAATKPVSNNDSTTGYALPTYEQGGKTYLDFSRLPGVQPRADGGYTGHNTFSMLCDLLGD